MINNERSYTTYVYDGSFNGLITCIYNAYYDKVSTEEIYIVSETEDYSQSALFDREVAVETSEEKAKRVMSALIKKVSYDVYYNIYMVYLSYYPQKGELIYRYVKMCFSMGKKVLSHISHPVVAEINRISRRVSGEKHKYLGFIRFAQIESGAYFSKINPENNQLELIAPHFLERMPNENWIIYDERRGLACVHKRNEGFMITDDIPLDIFNNIDKLSTKEELTYNELWKAFFNTIGIKERYNPRCQRNLMPKRYWENMLEVKDKL